MKSIRFKHAAFAVLAALSLLTSAARSQTVTGFSDLNYWGTGSNHSALVISWNDGKTNSTIAWGFSWDGSKSVADMLLALASADPRLFVRIDSSASDSLGTAVFGIGYDANGNGIFSVTGAHDVDGNPTTPVFTAGISDMNTNSTKTEAPYFDTDPDAPVASANAAPGEAADHYAEGWWDNGFWEFSRGGVTTSYPGSWDSTFVNGISQTTIVNDGWYAFSITDPDYNSNIPGPATVAAVPEPSSVSLLALGGLALALTLRRRHA